MRAARFSCGHSKVKGKGNLGLIRAFLSLFLMKKAILAVDDEVPILDVLRDVLSDRGYEVFTSDRPGEALNILKEKQISLVLLDIHMPGKSGFDLYKELEGR